MTKLTNTILLFLLSLAALLSGCAPAPRFTDTPTKKQHHSVSKAGFVPYTGSVEVGKTWRGVASYYGGDFHGRKTANGEYFDMYAMTAAHKSLPFGTILEVKNTANGKTVKVRINDRGPFIEGREIDLSQGAAQRIGMLGAGIQEVHIRIVGLEQQ